VSGGNPFQPLVITKSDPGRLEVEWADGHRTRYLTSELRGLCPCARCVNEVTGVRMHDPASVASDMTHADVRFVGNYALTLRFSDGHDTGIFPFRFLREHDPAG
jgi:DUF971 family protein